MGKTPFGKKTWIYVLDVHNGNLLGRMKFDREDIFPLDEDGSNFSGKQFKIHNSLTQVFGYNNGRYKDTQIVKPETIDLIAKKSFAQKPDYIRTGNRLVLENPSFPSRLWSRFSCKDKNS